MEAIEVQIPIIERKYSKQKRSFSFRLRRSRTVDGSSIHSPQGNNTNNNNNNNNNTNTNNNDNDNDICINNNNNVDSNRNRCHSPSARSNNSVKADLLSPGQAISRRSSIYRKPDKDDSGLIHIIPDIELPLMSFNDQYNIEKVLAEGCFAKILLTTHRPTQTEVVLKAVHAELTTIQDFQKEFHFSYELSHHQNILNTYNVAFQTKDYYVFAMEHAPYGDLASSIGANGLHENACKLIADQLSSALSFMHSKNLVHRDLKLENVLVFAVDFSRIKLCDFGAATRKGLLVHKLKHTWTSFVPPEILEIVKNERITCMPSSDSWQFGILIYHILTGSPPWNAADWVKDTQYSAFMKYEQRKTTKMPDNFRKFSARLMRCFRKYLCHDPEERCKITEITKYLKDRWVECRLTASKSATLITQNTDQDSCIYLNQKDNRNTNVDENKTRLKRIMSNYGLEKTLDQETIRKRVLEWLATCDNNFDTEIESLIVADEVH